MSLYDSPSFHTVSYAGVKSTKATDVSKTCFEMCGKTKNQLVHWVFLSRLWDDSWRPDKQVNLVLNWLSFWISWKPYLIYSTYINISLSELLNATPSKMNTTFRMYPITSWRFTSFNILFKLIGLNCFENWELIGAFWRRVFLTYFVCRGSWGALSGDIILLAIWLGVSMGVDV